jgi:hypothetical protein
MKPHPADPRRETLARLTAAPLDLLVVGGGIVGSGVARDAAMRGLRTGLVGHLFGRRGEVAVLVEVSDEQRHDATLHGIEGKPTELALQMSRQRLVPRDTLEEAHPSCLGLRIDCSWRGEITPIILQPRELVLLLGLAVLGVIFFQLLLRGTLFLQHRVGLELLPHHLLQL